MTPDPLTDALLGGFADAPVQSAHAFRASLDALARPGTIRAVQGATPPAPLSVAAGVLVLTLCDGTTPLHLAGAHDCQGLRAWITFHTGAPLVGAGDASFAAGFWEALQPVARFRVGTPDYPDRSATPIIELPCLAATGPRLTGPGIATEARLSLPETAAFQANRSRFPMGFDCFLTSCPVATAQMAVIRRISATFKDLPGGQVLGPTFDYTHRLLDFKLAAEGGELPPAATGPRRWRMWRMSPGF